MQSDWQQRTPKENSEFVEREIIPRLIQRSSELAAGRRIDFGREEDDWVLRIQDERHVKMPKSLGCFLILVFGSVLIIVILFVKRFLL